MNVRMRHTVTGNYYWALTPEQVVALEGMGWEVDEPAQLVTPPGWVQAMPFPALDGGVGLHPSGLDSWWEALTDSATNPVDVVVIGDSIAAQGTVADPAWPWLLGRLLATRSRNRTSDQVVFPNGSGSAPPVTSPGGTGTEAGMGGWARSLASGQNLSHVGSCDAVSVVYTGGGGTLTIKDGGSGGTTLATIDTSGESGASKVWTSSSLTYASHDIWVGCTVSATVVEALYLHRDGSATGGVRVWPAVHHGYDSEDFTTNTNRGLDLVSTLDAAGTLALVILATGTNDSVPGGSTYEALIEAVQDRTDVPIVAWIPFVNNQVTAAEADAMRATAAVYDLPVIDADRLDPRFGATKTGDGTHPVQSYQQLLADQVHAVVGGDPIGQALRDVPRLGTTSTQAAPGDIAYAKGGPWTVLAEDFIRGALPADWTATTASGGTNLALTVPTLNHPGSWRVNATTTTGSTSALTWVLNSYIDTTWRASFWFRCNNIGSGPLYRIGMLSVDSAGASVLGGWLEKTNGQTTWRWASQAFLGSVSYTTLTSPPTLDSSWHVLDIYRSGSTMLVLLDGVLQAIPSVPANIGSPCFQAHDAGSSATCSMDVDRVEFAISGMSR